MQDGKLYVGNLSYSVTNNEVEELFSTYGEVREVNIIEGRGFGFVELANPSEAEKAKEALDGTEFQGRTLKVDEARPQRSEVKMQGSKLYVGNLDYSVSNEQLEELFSTYGEIKELNIIEGRGFGFVELANPSEAEKAKEALDGTEFQGRTLKVDEARPQKRREKRDYRRY